MKLKTNQYADVAILGSAFVRLLEERIILDRAPAFMKEVIKSIIFLKNRKRYQVIDGEVVF